jgi:hypothetical protein
MGVKLRLTLMKGRRSRVFEYRALRQIFGAKRDEVTGELSIMRSFTICTPHHILW